MDNKDRIVKRQPKVNRKATFKEYSRFSYEKKKLFLKAHNIALGECKGIYNKTTQEITFGQYKNPFTGSYVSVKKVFTGNMKYLPDEFQVQANLIVIHLPKSQEHIFDVTSVRMTRKALNITKNNNDALPLQHVDDFNKEQSQKIKDNVRSTSPKPKKNSLLKEEKLYQYNGLPVKYLVNYLPKHKYSQDAASEKLLGVKNGAYRDIMWAVDLLYNEIEEYSNICIVPSSTAGNTSKMTPVIKALEEKKKINYLPVIQRIKNKDKFHSGGKRTPENEYKTLMISDSDLIKDKNIILIDDICTTGCSLFASYMLLKKSGAKHVDCIVLGRTK